MANLIWDDAIANWRYDNQPGEPSYQGVHYDPAIPESAYGLNYQSPHEAPRQYGSTSMMRYALTRDLRQQLEQTYQQTGRTVINLDGSNFVQRQGPGQWSYIEVPPTQGGAQINPDTGEVHYFPTEQGGLFGLGDVWGSVVGTGLVLGAGFGLGAGASALGVAPGTIGVGGLGAGGAGAASGVAGGSLPLAAIPAVGDSVIPASVGGLASTLAGPTGATAGPIVGGAGVGTLAGAAAADTLGTAAGIGAADVGISALAPGALGTTFTGAAPSFAGATFTPLASNALAGIAPYAPLISTGIGALGSVIGGAIQGNAARDAAQTQADAARAANQVQLDMYNQNRADLAPYRTVGYGALAQQAQMMDQPLTYGDYTAPAVLDPSGYAFDERQYAFTPPSGQQVLTEDPGYQFRVQQGQLALDRQAAGRGTLLSGGQLKGAARFSQDLASQEYGNAYQRRLTQNQLGYERALAGNQQTYGRAMTANEQAAQRGLQQYQTNLGTRTALRNLRYNELAGLAGTGQVATNLGAQLGAQTGANVGNNLTSAGAAQAAGQVGAANALAGGIQGVGNAANQYIQYQMLNNLLSQRR